MAIGIYFSTRRNYRRREEHGSAKWGNADALNKKYRDKDPSENKLLTQNVRIGLDGKKHRRNLNILVCGGSGAGKTRFFCKPNAMQCNTSFVVLDPKGEIVRDIGGLLESKGYEVRVLDLINMNTAANEYNYRFKLTDYALFDRNRARQVGIYGRVSTEHEAQLSALENQLQWYDDQVRYHPNWTVYDRYIDEGITGTQAKKRPAFLRMLEDARKGKFDLIVTREVCRFARNVVDTLVVTRELKSIGVEVYFIDDNIWTMDGDGELRLSLMATLAQEESRKTSERVKAGQKISRDNGVLYGNGNILGYDRVGDTYVINEEQAETVRMIFDLYLQGFGSMKIAQILTERKRKTATGLIKWSVSNIMRAIKNATYTGTKCYNKSRSNNFLEQKRINNLDMSTYEYVEGDFPAIVSQEIWDKAQAIRESRMKPALVSAEKTTHSKRDSRDIWVNKLRCSCGSSYRKNKWHTKLDGKTSYGYQCYNQLNNGIRRRSRAGADRNTHRYRTALPTLRYTGSYSRPLRPPP